MYLDATYAQIDHRLAGKIVQVHEVDFAQFFAGYLQAQPSFVPFDSYAEKTTAIEYIDKYDQFNHLVSTLL